MRRVIETLWRRIANGDPRACWPLAVLFALAIGHGLLVDVHQLGWGDWDQFTARSVVAHRSWTDFGQPPFWSPYHCGGSAITDDFQSRAWSPSFLLVLVFGPWWGNRLWMLCALALGFEGARRLAARLGAGPWGALFAAVTVAGNGSVTSRMAIGHFGDVPYLLLPWWLLAFERTRRDLWRGVLVGGCWGALCYLEAGIYTVVYGALILGAWSCMRARDTRSLRPLGASALILLATAGLSMHVMAPGTLFTLQALKRDLVPEMIPLSALPTVFFSPNLDWRRLVFPEQHWRWHEYATFVGPVFAGGLLLACLRPDRRVWGWLALGVFFTAYALGDIAPASPWTLLHRLPVFGSMRASGRAFVPAVLCFSLAGAMALDRWRIAPVVALALAAQFGAVSPSALRGAFTIQLPPVQPDPTFSQRADRAHFQLIFRHHYSLMTLDVLQNRGSLSCYDPVMPRRYARVLWPNPEILLSGTTGEAHVAEWSPNRIRLAFAHIARPGLAIVNQNRHRGWRTSDGRPLDTDVGVLAIPVRAGDTSVELSFAPPGFFAGLGVLALTLSALSWAAWRSRRQARD